MYFVSPLPNSLSHNAYSSAEIILTLSLKTVRAQSRSHEHEFRIHKMMGKLWIDIIVSKENSYREVLFEKVLYSNCECVCVCWQIPYVETRLMFRDMF